MSILGKIGSWLDYRDFLIQQGNSSEFSLASIDTTEDTVVFIAVDDEKLIGEMTEEISFLWEKELLKGEVVFLDGRLNQEGGDIDVFESTIEDFSLDCRECSNKRMFDSDKQEFYCPRCDQKQ